MKHTVLPLLTALSFILLTFKAAGEQKPNVILIIADDQGYSDIGINPHAAEDVKTPHLDELAARGVYFTHAYSSAPICNASRTGMITGQHQAKLGVFWYKNPGLKNFRGKTLAELLKDSGYATAYVGKVHYGNSSPNSKDFPTNHGFDYFYGFSGGRKHYLKHDDKEEEAFLERQQSAGKDTDNPVKREGGITKFESLKMNSMWENDKKVAVNELSTTLFGDKARAFISQNKGKPFYLQLSFNAVHNFTHQLPESYKKAHGITGIVQDWDPSKEDYLEWYRKGRAPNNPEGRVCYLAHLHFLDQEIGKLTNHLQEQGLSGNTIVIYISDNGGSTPIYANNAPLRGSKYTLLEGGIRIPMIISVPHGRQQSITDSAASTLDLLPTICALTETPLTQDTDGRNLSPLLLKDESTAALKESPMIWDSGHEYAVLRGKWKYHAVKDNADAKLEMVDLPLGEFLYNLEEDPGERNNLAKQFPEKLEELKQLHLRWRERLPLQP